MDLLGDIGTADQLTAARAENAVLSAKVKELSAKVKVLQVENQSLLAEVEMYRKEAALPNFSKLALGQAADSTEMDTDDHHKDHFVRSGNGVYPSDPVVTLKNLHGASNPLSCALSRDDTLLATGGADGCVRLCQWGAALAPSANASESAVQNAKRLSCPAPVICVAFCAVDNLVAAGCMDGSIHVWMYDKGGVIDVQSIQVTAKHAKYVKTLAWCPTAPLLATASADGNIILSQKNGSSMDTVRTLHLPGTVETVCFSQDGTVLFCYTRGTPYLSKFELDKDCEQTKIGLNGGVNGGFEDHVSFAVMDMAVSPDGKYIALATDASRNIVLETASGKQIRNLYGHKNDGFSQPKIAWSNNGQYIFGNTQDESVVCVWDIASSTIVKRLEGHSNPVRDLYSSKHSDTLVTTSFDKTTMIWLTAA